MKSFEEIKAVYEARWPELANIKYGPRKKWAQAALQRMAPAGISPAEVWELARIANEEKEPERGYSGYWIGAPRDGETIAKAATEPEAVLLALEALHEHKGEFEPTWGGVGITDPEGREVEW